MNKGKDSKELQTDVGNRLLEFIYSVAKNENDFAKKIGLERTDNIYRVTKYGGNAGPKLIDPIIKAFPEFDSNWLLTGKKSSNDQVNEDQTQYAKENKDNNMNTSETTMQAILKLVESNNKLSEAALKQSEANIIQARANENLTISNKELTGMLKSSTADGDLKNQAKNDAKLDRAIRAVAVVLAAKKPLHDEEGIYQELSKHVFSIQKDSEFSSNLDKADKLSRSNLHP